MDMKLTKYNNRYASDLHIEGNCNCEMIVNKTTICCDQSAGMV